MSSLVGEEQAGLRPREVVTQLVHDGCSGALETAALFDVESYFK